MLLLSGARIQWWWWWWQGRWWQPQRSKPGKHCMYLFSRKTCEIGIKKMAAQRKYVKCLFSVRLIQYLNQGLFKWKLYYFYFDDIFKELSCKIKHGRLNNYIYLCSLQNSTNYNKENTNTNSRRQRAKRREEDNI